MSFYKRIDVDYDPEPGEGESIAIDGGNTSASVFVWCAGKEQPARVTLNAEGLRELAAACIKAANCIEG